jgi:hypothetical protein
MSVDLNLSQSINDFFTELKWIFSFVEPEKIYPTNLKEEQEKFKLDQTYNPVFTYEAAKITGNYQKHAVFLEEKLKGMNLPKDLEEYLQIFIVDTVAWLDLNASIGTKDFAKVANNYFKKYDYSKIVFPELTTREVTAEEARFLTPEQQQEVFKRVLNELGFIEWQVIFATDGHETLRVFPSKSEIILSATSSRTVRDIKRLIIHEIGGHVFREYNARNLNPLVGTDEFSLERQLAEEGHSVYLEDRARMITPGLAESYNLSVKGVLNLDKSFAELFKLLAQDKTFEHAFSRTYRVKRGLIHTQEPGGYAKDIAYLFGYKLIKDHLANGGDLSFISTGNFAPQDMILDSYGLINKEGALNIADNQETLVGIVDQVIANSSD